MSKCKNCAKPNNNGTKFCTRKCRKEWERESRADYKKYMQGMGDRLHFGVVYDYEGNSGGDQ